MLKAFRCRFLCCLLVLLSRQVSGTFYQLASITPTTSTKVSCDHIGSGWEQELGTVAKHGSDGVAYIHTIRGGGVGLMVSDFNDYIGASKARSWAVLAFSILTDTVAVTLMKTAQEESSVQKLVLSFLGFFFSLAGFALALKSIDVSIAYAIWASVGTAIVSIVGIVFFGERLNLTKIACLTLILLGTVGLELTDEH